MSKLQRINDLIIDELARRWNKPLEENSPSNNDIFFNNVGELASAKGFYEIVFQEIQIYRDKGAFDIEMISQFLVSLAIDSETESVLDLLESHLTKKQLVDIILLGSTHPWGVVRYQIVKMSARGFFENKEAFLYSFLIKETHPYLIRIVLKMICEIDLKLAKKIAVNHIESKDSYLRVLAREIIEG